MHFVIVVIGVILIVAAAATAAVKVKGIGSRQAAEHLGVDVLAMQCTRQAPHPLLPLLLHHWTQAARGGGVRDLLIGTRLRVGFIAIQDALLKVIHGGLEGALETVLGSELLVEISGWLLLLLLLRLGSLLAFILLEAHDWYIGQRLLLHLLLDEVAVRGHLVILGLYLWIVARDDILILLSLYISRWVISMRYAKYFLLYDIDMPPSLGI